MTSQNLQTSYACLRAVQIHSRNRCCAVVLLAAATAFLLPGCIVGEMRDDLKATRIGVQNLSDLGPQLAQTNAAIIKAHAQIELGNAQLVELQKQITSMQASIQAFHPRLDDANSTMQDSVRQLKHLEPMMASMRNLDESLASLRKMLENIGRAIPLLNVTGGTPSADRALERQRETPQPSTPAPDATQTPTSPK